MTDMAQLEGISKQTQIELLDLITRILKGDRDALDQTVKRLEALASNHDAQIPRRETMLRYYAPLAN